MSPRQHQNQHNGKGPYSKTSTEISALPQPLAATNGSSPPCPGKRPPRFAAQSAVLNDPRLGPGPVRLYFMLDDCAGAAGGADDRCYPSEAWLAKRVGVSVRSIRRWLAQLQKSGHLIVKRTQRGNRYTLAWAVSERKEMSGRAGFREDRNGRSERPNMSGAYKEYPHQETISPRSSSSSSYPINSGGRKDDDDDQNRPRERKTQTLSPTDPLVMDVRLALLAWFDQRKYPKPSDRAFDPIPDNVIANEMRNKGASIRDLKNFLDDEYSDHLIDPPVTWKHVSRSVLNWLATYGVARTPSNSDRAREKWKAERARERQMAEPGSGGQNEQNEHR